MITEKENAWRVINRTGDAQWIPDAGKCFEMIVPSAVIRERPTVAEGSGYDWFNCYWYYDQEIDGFCPLPGKEPIKDITNWEKELTLPDLEAVDWENAVKPLTENLNRKDKITYFLWESGPWERLHALIGFQEALEALYIEPEAVKELLEVLTDYKVRTIEYIAEYFKPDILCNFDDFGHQKGLFMSPDMFREFLLPCEKRIGEALEKKGITYSHHSCGKIDSLMGDILESGAVMLDGLWAPYNDMNFVEENHSKKFTVLGSMNTQLLADPDADEESLRAEVRRVVDACAPYKNLIFNPGMIHNRRTMDILQDEFDTYSKDYWVRNNIK